MDKKSIGQWPEFFGCAAFQMMGAALQNRMSSEHNPKDAFFWKDVCFLD